jgi:plastocyanin
MRISLTRLSAGIATATAFVALSAAASAQTFCVHGNTNCAGMPADTLQDALNAAANNGAGTRDKIMLPAGSFADGPAVDVAGNAVDIVGVNRYDTWLTASGDNHTVLSINEPSSTVSKVHVQVNGGGNETGIRLAGGKLDEVSVWSLGPPQSVTGIWVVGPNSTITNSVVVLRDFTTQPWVVAVQVDTGDSVSIADSHLVARRAVDVGGGSANLERTSLDADQGVDAHNDSSVVLRNSTVYSPGVDPSLMPPVALNAHGSGTNIIDALQSTIYNRLDQGIGVLVDPVVGNAALVELTDSVVSGHATVASVLAGGTLNTQWSAYEFGKVTGAGAHNHANDLDLTGKNPGFYVPSAQYFQLRHDSPLINAGDPNASTSGDLDYGRAARIVDGRVDIGAHEYQHGAPKLSAGSDLTTADPGQLVTFTAAATDVDIADTLTYEWSFDDGTKTSGDKVQHAFATPGAHTATATVTDSSGLEASATVDVTVTGTPPATDTSQPGTITSAPAVAPLLKDVRLSPTTFRPLRTKPHGSGRRVHAGSKLSFTLSQDTTLAVVIEQRKAGRWTRVGTVKAKRAAGRRSIAITGRVSGRPLPAGRYRLRLVARNAAGLASAPSQLRFKVVR